MEIQRKETSYSILKQCYDTYDHFVITRKICLPLIVLVIGYFLQCTLMNWYDPPVIEISTGKLKGKWATSRGGNKYIEFLNIPYASPPVGTRRFESPQPAESWEGIRDSQHIGPECVGAQFISTGRIQGQEDCLNLNLYVSSIKKNDTHRKSRPTIVYFHGGGFLMGSTYIHGAKYFGDFLDECNLVVVNYRLGSFGFLNSGPNGKIRGNMGMKDQRLALKWIQENIEYFPNSDKNNVVIVGESAGAISVHLHMLSPSSKGLFRKAISMSGVAANFDWAMTKNHTNAVLRLGEKVNCQNPTDLDRVIECLKNADAYEIAQVHLEEALDPFSPLDGFFLPSLESLEDSDTFLSQRPSEILKSGNYNTVPFMLGTNEQEGLIYILRLIQGGIDLKSFQQREVWNKYMPQLLYHENQSPEISNQLYDHYFGKGHFENDTEEVVIRKLTQIFSDKFFFQPTHNAAILHSQFATTYLYHYTYQSPINVFNLLRTTVPSSYIPFELEIGFGLAKNLIKSVLGFPVINFGAGHGDDVSLLFDCHPAMEIHRFHPDFAISRSLIRLIVDFAKDSNSLRYENIDWSPVSQNTSSKIPCMKLDSMPELINSPITSRAKFWNSLDLKLYNII